MQPIYLLNILRILTVYAMNKKTFFVPNLSSLHVPLIEPLIPSSSSPSDIVPPLSSCSNSGNLSTSISDNNASPSSDCLHIYFQNINGMRSKICDFKLAVLEEDYDIIVVVETWLYPDILSNEFLFDNSYVTYRRDRCVNKFQRRGGILLAVKSKFISCLVPLNHGDELEQLCVRISQSTEISYNLNIFLSYIPPASLVDVYNKHVDNILLQSDISGLEQNLIFLGDFNLPGIEWEFDVEDKLLIPFNVSSETERIVVDSLISNNFIQINCVPNFHGKFLDLVFLSDDFHFSVSEVESPLASTDFHHKAICISLDRYTFLPDISPRSSSSLDFCFGKTNFAGLNSYLSGINWFEHLDGLNLNDMYIQLVELLHIGYLNHVPKIARRNNSDPPWFSKSLRKLKNARNKAHTRFLSHGGVHFRRIFVQHRREFQFLHRFLYRNYLWSIEQNLKLDSKRFWVYINSSKKSSGYPNQMVYKDQISTDLQTSVNLFADYFCTVYNSDQNIPVPIFSNLSPITDLGSIDISESEVICAMQLLDNNASPDRDNICNLILKNCCAFLGQPLRTIFLESLNSGLFLDGWKFSTITPIFKSGHKHEIVNYRGITKLMVIPKLFEAIVKTKIYEKVKNSISPFQHGFVAGRSTSTNLVLFTNFLINSIEKGSQIDVVYTVFSKAFDRVIISHLIQKLAALGFHPTLLLWIGSYLSNRFQVVQIGKFSSYCFKASSGVPQGSHLGLVLFILMINDLPLLSIVDVCR